MGHKGIGMDVAGLITKNAKLRWFGQCCKSIFKNADVEITPLKNPHFYGLTFRFHVKSNFPRSGCANHFYQTLEFKRIG